MRKLLFQKAFAIMLAFLLTVTLGCRAFAVELIPGGVPFGVKLYCEGVLVVDVGRIKIGEEYFEPAKDAGIKAKDIITEINGVKISSVEEVVAAVTSCSGNSLLFTLKRGAEKITAELKPIMSPGDGKYRAGLWVRDSTAGIGTVTFIDPNTGAFAGLGHGICDIDTGELMPLERGIVVNISINGVKKGKVGSPGELRGYFSSGKIGSLVKNSEYGVFGVLLEYPEGIETKTVSTASASEVCEGEAELWCTVEDGLIQKYKVKISNIVNSGRGTKNFVVTICDENLLLKTGGIVQGMSGSPIIQNGKLIGAVTHVLVNDPTRGYGIFIENMLGAAE